MKRLSLLRAMLIGFVLLGSNYAHAQFDQVFLHRGFIFGNYTGAPYYYAPSVAYQQRDDTLSYKNNRSFQMGLNWGGRMNLYDFSDQKSISLHVDFVGTGYLGSGLIKEEQLGDLGLALQIPIVVNFNFGHMATSQSPSSHGFGVGLGVEINRVYSLIEKTVLYTIAADRGFLQAGSASFVQPVVNFGYRYWNSNDKARELNLQFGFGKAYHYVHGTSYRPNVRLSLHKYFNY